MIFIFAYNYHIDFREICEVIYEFGKYKKG